MVVPGMLWMASSILPGGSRFRAHSSRTDRTLSEPASLYIATVGASGCGGCSIPSNYSSTLHVHRAQAPGAHVHRAQCMLTPVMDAHCSHAEALPHAWIQSLHASRVCMHPESACIQILHASRANCTVQPLPHPSADSMHIIRLRTPQLQQHASAHGADNSFLNRPHLLTTCLSQSRTHQHPAPIACHACLIKLGAFAHAIMQLAAYPLDGMQQAAHQMHAGLAAIANILRRHARTSQIKQFLHTSQSCSTVFA